MDKPSKERLKELDEVNILWLLRQFSLGNLVRAFYRLKECVGKTAAAFKKSCEETSGAARDSDPDSVPDVTSPRDSDRPVALQREALRSGAEGEKKKEQ